jgi:hypothetical protein
MMLCRMAVFVHAAVFALPYSPPLVSSTISPTPPYLVQVMLLQVGQDGRWNTRFMYEPVFRTLVDGFEAYSHRENLRFTASTNMTLDKDHIILTTSVLGAGDLFVWLGLAGHRLVPWLELHARGVRTVYYRSEPHGECIMRYHGIDEAWDYSRIREADQRGRCAETARPLRGATAMSRYLPPGWPAGARIPAKQAFVTALPEEPRPRLTFLGQLCGKASSSASRAVCVRRIESAMR